MAFTKISNESKGILFLVLFVISLVSSTNIDCNGKSYHCVNSTHFMICVDLGAGVSTTVDDFVIPCPPPTECKITNRFECEFQVATTPAPILRTSDVTNELEMSATTVPWENIAVTTNFATSDSELSDLKNFNNESLTTLSGATSSVTTNMPVNANDDTTTETVIFKNVLTTTTNPLFFEAKVTQILSKNTLNNKPKISPISEARVTELLLQNKLNFTNGQNDVPGTKITDNAFLFTTESIDTEAKLTEGLVEQNFTNTNIIPLHQNIIDKTIFTNTTDNKLETTTESISLETKVTTEVLQINAINLAATNNMNVSLTNKLEKNTTESTFTTGTESIYTEAILITEQKYASANLSTINKKKLNVNNSTINKKTYTNKIGNTLASTTESLYTEPLPTEYFSENQVNFTNTKKNISNEAIIITTENSINIIEEFTENKLSFTDRNTQTLHVTNNEPGIENFAINILTPTLESISKEGAGTGISPEKLNSANFTNTNESTNVSDTNIIEHAVPSTTNSIHAKTNATEVLPESKQNITLFIDENKIITNTETLTTATENTFALITKSIPTEGYSVPETNYTAFNVMSVTEFSYNGGLVTEISPEKLNMSNSTNINTIVATNNSTKQTVMPKNYPIQAETETTELLPENKLNLNESTTSDELLAYVTEKTLNITMETINNEAKVLLINTNNAKANITTNKTVNYVSPENVLNLSSNITLITTENTVEFTTETIHSEANETKHLLQNTFHFTETKYANSVTSPGITNTENILAPTMESTYTEAIVTNVLTEDKTNLTEITKNKAYNITDGTLIVPTTDKTINDSEYITEISLVNQSGISVSGTNEIVSPKMLIDNNTFPTIIPILPALLNELSKKTIDATQNNVTTTISSLADGLQTTMDTTVTINQNTATVGKIVATSNTNLPFNTVVTEPTTEAEIQTTSVISRSVSDTTSTITKDFLNKTVPQDLNLTSINSLDSTTDNILSMADDNEIQGTEAVSSRPTEYDKTQSDFTDPLKKTSSNPEVISSSGDIRKGNIRSNTTGASTTMFNQILNNTKSETPNNMLPILENFTIPSYTNAKKDYNPSTATNYITHGTHEIHTNFNKENQSENWHETNRIVTETTNTIPVNVTEFDFIGNSTHIMTTNETQTANNIKQTVTVTEMAATNTISFTNRLLSTVNDTLNTLTPTTATNTTEKTITPIEFLENFTLGTSTFEISNSSFNVIQENQLAQKEQNETTYSAQNTAIDISPSESTPKESEKHILIPYTNKSIPDPSKINTLHEAVQTTNTLNDTAILNSTFTSDIQNTEKSILLRSTPLAETIGITLTSILNETNTSPITTQYVENTNLTGEENDSMGFKNTKILPSTSDATSYLSGSSLTNNISNSSLSHHSTDSKTEQMVPSTTFSSIETSTLNSVNNLRTHNSKESNLMRSTYVANTFETTMVTENIPSNPFSNVLFNTLTKKNGAHVKKSYIPEQFTPTESIIPDDLSSSNNQPVKNMPNTSTKYAIKEDNGTLSTTSDSISNNVANRSTQNMGILNYSLKSADNVTLQAEKNKNYTEGFVTLTTTKIYEGSTSPSFLPNSVVTQLETGKTTFGTNSGLTPTENILLHDTTVQTPAIKNVTKLTFEIINKTAQVKATSKTTDISNAENSSVLQNGTLFETLPSIVLTQNANINIKSNEENVYNSTNSTTTENKTVKENLDNKLTPIVNKTKTRSTHKLTIYPVLNINYTEDFATSTTITDGIFPEILSTRNSLINDIQLTTTRSEALLTTSILQDNDSFSKINSNTVVSSNNKIDQESGHVTYSIFHEVKSGISTDDLHHLVEINQGGLHITSSGLASSSKHGREITPNTVITDATIVHSENALNVITSSPIKDVTATQNKHTAVFAKNSTLLTTLYPVTIVNSIDTIKTRHELNEEHLKKVTQDFSVNPENASTSVVTKPLTPLETVETTASPKRPGSDITNTKKHIAYETAGFTETSLPKIDKNLDQVNSTTKLTNSTPTPFTKFTVQQTLTIGNVINSINNIETNTESLQSNFKVNNALEKSDNAKLNEEQATNKKKEFTIQNIATMITTKKIITNEPTATKPILSNTLVKESSTIKHTTNVEDYVHTNGMKTSTSNFDCKYRPRGRYGDNNDCRKFYICIGRPQPIVGLCPVDTVFSEFRTQCTKNLSHCIRENQFHCSAEGRFFDYLTDNIYYICVKNQLHFTRFKFQCQKGYHLDKQSVKCLQDIETSTQPLFSKAKPVSSNDFTCKHEGKFPDRDFGNNIYYMCVKNKQNAFVRFKFQCQKGYHLNKTIVRCLQDIIEARYQSQSVSSKDSVSKDESVTIKKKDFECKEPGKFADPDDCRKYYLCSLKKKSNFVRKRKKCDSDEVFNKDKKKCVDTESYEC